MFVSTRPAKPEEIKSNLVQLTVSDLSVFSYYREAAIKRDDKGNPAISGTETIEKAFVQLSAAWDSATKP